MKRPSIIGTALLVLLLLSGAVTAVMAQETDDPFVWIPEELTTELTIQAAYNGQQIFWRFEWPAEVPHFSHDTLVYRDGQWQRHGASPVGSQEFGLYEDRLTFLVSPGTVRAFEFQGCYVGCHDGLRFLSNQLDSAAIQAHPLLGETQGRTDLRKYILESREGTVWWDVPWDAVKSADELEALAEASVFLDFWHWRAHRGNPIGYSDDQYVLEYRNNDGTRTAYATNWDADAGQPLFMFDEEQVGFVALNWDRLINREYTQDDVYYLSEDLAAPFDPDRDWQEGDVIPRVWLRTPEGSQASILGDGRWEDGVWRLELQRDMDTGFPTTDHALLEGRTYTIGFAAHKNATGSRWHYISHPQRVGIGTPADITAVRFTGRTPNWDEVPSVTIPLWYPGQITWEWLTSDAHPGAAEVRADTRSCASCHGSEPADVLKLAQASVFHETSPAGIPLNWLLTLIAVLAVLVGGTFSAINLFSGKGKE
jgi:hypothetical protein